VFKFLHNLDRKKCNILLIKIQNKIQSKSIALKIGGENMACRKCDTTKKAGSKRSSSRTEASTDNAKTSSRATSKKTSRTKNCN